MGGVASAGNYPHRPNTVERVRLVEEVFRRALEEMRDTGNTSEMFEPYANLVLYAQANRKIQEELQTALT
jgi:hypothetical protein